MTLQQEIEKILNDNLSGDYAGYIYGIEPTCQLLRKLFLSKQIELLGQLQGTAGVCIMTKKLQLESELNNIPAKAGRFENRLKSSKDE